MLQFSHSLPRSVRQRSWGPFKSERLWSKHDTRVPWIGIDKRGEEKRGGLTGRCDGDLRAARGTSSAASRPRSWLRGVHEELWESAHGVVRSSSDDGGRTRGQMRVADPATRETQHSGSAPDFPEFTSLAARLWVSWSSGQKRSAMTSSKNV